MSYQDSRDAREGFELAIIGAAGRFPGARSLSEFWQKLRNGSESISFFTDEEMKSKGVDATVLRDPNFIKAGAVLDGADLFDASFFGFSPREAELLDPQHRVFLECAWEALEDAGYNPDAYDGMIGVYAGTSLSTYLLFNVLATVDWQDSFEAMVGNDKGFLSTRVSYELNLKGPSVDIQSACSTSLVAVHLAFSALINYQCDMALAGGISIQVPQRTGYYYQKGGISSPDGHCRAFDAKAEGTVFGSGAGIVILKRLSDALADGDTIRAIIKGSAINNDGSSKIGYTAPSVDGQAQVISLAQMVAGVEPQTISYIEAHGTGTALGDPVEVAALTKAFRLRTQAKRFCAIGSVKTNIGHLDAAAGVAGLIKTMLALEHKLLPPSLHYEKPNPQMELDDSPFYVNAALSEWKWSGTPRRAGVSSFGIGGTNAHVIVEEAPPPEPSGESRDWQLLVLSARTGTALETTAANLIDHLKSNPDINLPDAAYTLQLGRKVFNYRQAVICRDVQDAVLALESLKPERAFTAYQGPDHRPVVFMFPGGGAQYVNMGLDLYRKEPVFRAHIDECSELLVKHLDYDLRNHLYPEDGHLEMMSNQMKGTSLGLTALFAVEYAMARLWMSWGVVPEAMIGHSLGEYVAACVAGVFTLEDALALVFLRARLFERLPGGAMLSVPLPANEVRDLLGDSLCIAAINGPSQCVVSGPKKAIEEMATLLATREVDSRRLQIDVAAHSQMVTPVLREFREFVDRLELRPPRIPYMSNVTAEWITDREATDPHYWEQHLAQTVRFGDGLQQLFDDPDRIFLEIGPGRTLSTLAKLQCDNSRLNSVFASMRHPYEQSDDVAVLLTSLGKLWLVGAQIEWHGFYAGERRRRLALPTYPFERQRYWIEPAPQALERVSSKQQTLKNSDLSAWFHTPSWKKTLPVSAGYADQAEIEAGSWLVFEDETGLGRAIAANLNRQGKDLITVAAGPGFEKGEDAGYRIRAGESEDYDRLIREVHSLGRGICRVVHLWSLSREAGAGGSLNSFEREQEVGFYSLIYLAHALEKAGIGDRVRISVVSNNLDQVESRDVVRPEKSTILGPCKVIPQEIQSVDIRVIDVELPGPGTTEQERLAERLITETEAEANGEFVAYRGDNRWAQIFEPVRLESSSESNAPKKWKGVYFITGGLGGVGLSLAEHLAEKVKARLVLTQRSVFPPREEWDRWLERDDAAMEVTRKIRRVMALEEKGAEVLVASADVANEMEMRSVLSKAIERFGRVDVVIHAAGVAGHRAVKLIPEVDRPETKLQFESKVWGLYVLETILKGHPVDCCLLFSSNAAVLGGLGLSIYSAANHFMDAFAVSRGRGNGTRWISANWDGWLLSEENRLTPSYQTSMDRYAMTSDESQEAFDRVMASDVLTRVVVSTGDLAGRLDAWIRLKGRAEVPADNGNMPGTLHSRPALGTAYVAPQSELEQKILDIWQGLLGIDHLGVNDNFFDLGGNSLTCLKVISRLKKDLGVDIPVITIFEGPTVSALATVIRRSDHNVSYEDSRIRGERRKGKKRRRKGLQKGATA
jgi:acyl transferase domain-containing protein/acyl carrier protein